METFISILIIILVAAILFFTTPLYVYCTKRTVQFIVKEKGTLTHGYVTNGNGQTWTEFMIYTQDNRSFKNINTIWYWKWHSTELQTKLEVGKKYSAKIYGWRIGLLDIYPNLINADKID